MKNKAYLLNGAEQPDLDGNEYRIFRMNFQRAILLSLLECGNLTQAQYERCMEKIRQRYAEKPTS